MNKVTKKSDTVKASGRERMKARRAHMLTDRHLLGA